MNSMMTTSQAPQTLATFLSEHKIEKGNPNKVTATHTVMPCVEDGIYGASYNIDNDYLEEFYKLYIDNLNNGGEYHFTEAQKIDSNDNIDLFRVDLDFRYNINITTRQHNEQDINDIVLAYHNYITKYLTINENFYIYVFEKANVNICEDKAYTKDGIHIVMTVKCPVSMQLLIRDKVMKSLQKKKVLDKFHLINNYEDVFDKGISTGKTNWTLIGSKKPRHEAYALTQYYYANPNNICQCEKPDSSYALPELDLKFMLSMSATNNNAIKPKICEVHRKDYDKKVKELYPDTKTKKETKKTTSSTVTNNDTPTTFGLAEIEIIVNAIQNETRDAFGNYKDLSILGYCIFNHCDGNIDGCKLFHTLSEKIPKYENENDCAKQYYKSQGGREKDKQIKYPSLVKILEELNAEHSLVKSYRNSGVTDSSGLTGVFTEVEASEKILKIFKHWVYCNDELYVFDNTTGMWNTSNNIHRKII
jgi:hypothetical protein